MSDSAPAELLKFWIARRAAPAAMAWLEQHCEEIASDFSGRALGRAISMTPRRMGKAALGLSTDDRAAASRAREGWTPVDWSLDRAARILLLLSAAQRSEGFAERLKALAATSDVGELVAIYSGLPLYPDPAPLTALATEGLRTAMRTIFEAVAHHNPFPAEQFPQGAWNHMVLKALFIDSPLHPIEGLDRRWNLELARIMCDYAHERWAAGRPVTPELWRGVGRFADDAAIADLARVLETGSAIEQTAAALALSESDQPAASRLLASRPDLATDVGAGRVNWAALIPETAVA